MNPRRLAFSEDQAAEARRHFGPRVYILPEDGADYNEILSRRVDYFTFEALCVPSRLVAEMNPFSRSAMHGQEDYQTLFQANSKAGPLLSRD